MPESNGSVPDYFPSVIPYNFPCVIEESLAPNEVQVTITLGSKTLYVLAPITRVNTPESTIQVLVVGEVGDDYLLSFPGEVENGTSTMRVDKSLVKIH